MIGIVVIAIVVGTVLLFFWGTGKYNTLVTLRKKCFDAWIDLTAADLEEVASLRAAGRTQDADALEAAAHLAVATFGRPNAPENLARVRSAVAQAFPRVGLQESRSTECYDKASEFYNTMHRQPIYAAIGRLTGLPSMPVHRFH